LGGVGQGTYVPCSTRKRKLPSGSLPVEFWPAFYPYVLSGSAKVAGVWHDPPSVRPHFCRSPASHTVVASVVSSRVLDMVPKLTSHKPYNHTTFLPFYVAHATAVNREFNSRNARGFIAPSVCPSGLKKAHPALETLSETRTNPMPRRASVFSSNHQLVVQVPVGVSVCDRASNHSNFAHAYSM